MRGIVQTVDEIDDAPVLGLARGTKLVERVEQDRIQPVRRLALAGEALHPDPVGREQMIERAVDRFEERAAIGAIVLGTKPRRRIVQPRVGPGIIVAEHLIMG
jgi:hypothetical protein